MADINNEAKNEKISALGNVSSKLNEYKGEFKRIIWPSKAELYKNTKDSIVICIVFGIIIFTLDFVFNYGMTFITRLVG
jgi:preprotein translocase subunit SecE